MPNAHFVPLEANFCAAVVRGPLHLLGRVEFMLDWLMQWLKYERRGRSFGVVVFDIDDTLVTGDSKEKALPTLKIYKLCQELGFACAIVTARPERDNNRELTIQMLHRVGVKDWESLYMMPPDVPITSGGISTYKRVCRDKIAKRHPIIANIGDMWTDLMVSPFPADAHFIARLPNDACCILFPPRSDGEVSIKLPSRT